MSAAMSDERTRLALLRAELGKSTLGRAGAGNLLLGVQEADDAALIEFPGNPESLVVASDFVRGSGFALFKRGLLSYEDLGYYLVAANLSDMAAMGALPLALTTIVRYSSEMSDDDFGQVFRGIRLASDAYNTPVVGGDIGGYENDVLAATAFGQVKRSDALLRSNARPDQLVCLAGSMGLPITALAYFTKAKPLGLALPVEDEARLLLSWRRPIARVQEGLILSRSRLGAAGQDVSDGLRATVEQIAAASDVSIVLREEQLPLDPSTEIVANFLGVSPLALAMSASVDFSLVFTIAPETENSCQHEFAAANLSFTVIGTVVTAGHNEIAGVDGKRRPLPGVAWRHQIGDWLGDVLAGKP